MLRCIIAEDERILRKGLILTTDWKSLDCEVVGEAENGLEALDLFKTKKPDLLITDIRMPLMDGLELIEKCRPLHSADYIIMSGYSDFSYAKKAIHLGVSEYILKPLDEEELFDAITKIKRERLKKNASPPPGLSRKGAWQYRNHGSLYLSGTVKKQIHYGSHELSFSKLRPGDFP